MNHAPGLARSLSWAYCTWFIGPYKHRALADTMAPFRLGNSGYEDKINSPFGERLHVKESKKHIEQKQDKTEKRLLQQSA